MPSPEAASKEAGAPADEIEITPAMIEAGLDELLTYNITDPDLDDCRLAVAAIYRRMRKMAVEDCKKAMVEKNT